MTLYNKVVDQIKKHQAAAEKAFTTFIDTSKTLKKGLKVPVEENANRLKKMKSEVESVKNTPIGSEDYGDLLEGNTRYQKQLEPVSLGFTAKERNKRLKAYGQSQQAAIEQTEEFIKERSESK